MPRLYEWIYFKRWGKVEVGIIVRLYNDDGFVLVYMPFKKGLNANSVNSIFRGNKFSVVFREEVVKWFEEN